ncbi:MAG: LCP family protein [Clostridia bacterium]|nr:LCP family protein [Clostridia bacterium]
MRGDQEARERRLRQICPPGLKKFGSVMGIIYIVLLIVLEALLIYIDILPLKYMCIVLVGLTLISLCLVPLLLIKNIKKNKKIPAVVIAVILVLVFALGIAYLGNTLGFFARVFGAGGETVDYDVLVRSSSEYEQVEEIEGKTVGTLALIDTTLSDAKDKLSEEVKVDYDMVDKSAAELCDDLIDQDYEVILLSDASYNTLCEENNSYEDKTKILYTVTVTKEIKSNKEVDVTKEPFNVLISGNDTTGEITDVAKSDVNMIMTVNPKTHKIRLTSIPRDYYVHVPSLDAYDKLTHTGNFGVDTTAETIEELLGIDVNYYVKVNFTCVVELVDAIGGIDVKSDYDFVTSGRQNNGYQFHVGMNHCDGAHALAFSRERHAFPSGDNQRVLNQQKVIEAMIKKCTSSTVILTKYGSILGAVGKYMKTNMSDKNVKKLAKLQLSDMKGWKITKGALVGTGATSTVYSLGSAQCYVMMPDQVSLAEASEGIHKVMKGEK